MMLLYNSKLNKRANKGVDMNQVVRVLEGEYGGKTVTDTAFPLIKPFKMGKNGGFITVDANEVKGFPNREIRIKLKSAGDYVATDGSVIVGEDKPQQTDEERIKEIQERFDILNEMTEAAIDGTVRGMIVSGPPGVGKSYGVEHVLEEHNMFDRLGDRPLKYEVVKGAMTPIGLYCLLYKNADAGRVLVLDDCDGILFDELALNLLKGALDSGNKRKINWNADSHKLRNEGVPDTFEFKGSVIFITNLKFDNMIQGGRLGKIKDHLEAILSRCHYLDLTLDTMRDKMLRIKQIVRDGMLEKYKFSEDEKQIIIKFIDDNRTKLREVSLRMVLKIADLYKMAPADNRWMRLAETTCMKRSVA